MRGKRADIILWVNASGFPSTSRATGVSAPFHVKRRRPWPSWQIRLWGAHGSDCTLRGWLELGHTESHVTMRDRYRASFLELGRKGDEI